MKGINVIPLSLIVFILLHYTSITSAWNNVLLTTKCNTFRSSTSLWSSSTRKDKKQVTKTNEPSLSIKPVRINKVLKQKHSRRETDALINQGLVKVNNKPISLGHKVTPYKDKIKVNGVNIKHWEQYIVNDDDFNENLLQMEDGNKKKKKAQRQHEYIKYWKPKGVQCSIDPSIENNILRRIQEKDRFIPKRRVFPVGYLDRDTSGKLFHVMYFNLSHFCIGLMLLTSDERVAKAIFKGVVQQPKTYKVYIDKPISNQDIRTLKVCLKLIIGISI